MTQNANAETLLITGGVSGLGLALARFHARRGDQLILVDRSAEASEAALSQLDGQAHFIKADLTDPEACDRLRRQVAAITPTLNRLYNNAGIAGSVGLMEHQTDANWQAVFGINLFAAVRLTRLLLPLLKAAPKAQIVNIASVGGLMCASHMSAYSASKAALISLSETLDKELAHDNISVTVACPAFFKTQLTNSIPPQEVKARARVEKLMASGKLNADQVAALIAGAADKGQFIALPHARERWLWYLKRLSYPLFRKVLISQQPRPVTAKENTHV